MLGDDDNAWVVDLSCTETLCPYQKVAAKSIYLDVRRESLRFDSMTPTLGVGFRRVARLARRCPKTGDSAPSPNKKRRKLHLYAPQQLRSGKVF